MPAVDDPFGIAASLPGQLKAVKDQVKDLASNNTQAVSQALAAAAAASAAANAAGVLPVVVHAESQAFAVSQFLHTGPPSQLQATASVAVPTGYTRALVMAISGLSCYNNTPGPGSLYLEVTVAGLASTSVPAMSSSAAANWYAALTVSNSKLLTSLGATIDICSYIGADSLWTASTYNLLNMNVSVIFLR